MKFLSLFPLLFCLLFAEENFVLVTGGAGYIGSHTCKVLHDAGFIPVTYDSLETGSKDAVKWGPLVIGDLTDRDTLNQAFIDYKPIAVLHFAALKKVGDSVKDPASYYAKNVIGSLTLLDLMVKHKVPYIVFSSSCSVYGNTDTALIDENCPRDPISPYATTKYIIERAIEDYAHAYGLHYITFRYFNAAGFDTESGIKRSLHTDISLIPTAVRTLLVPNTTLKILGTDYPTIDGSGVRDYIHVKDLAEAHALAVTYLQNGHSSASINLGTGKGHSVFGIVRTLESITNQTVPITLYPRRKGDIAEAVADTKKSKALLNFQPKHSDLKTILESEWISLQSATN